MGEHMPRRSKEGKIAIRLDLEGELAKDFDVVRKYYRIETATDLVRFLITQERRRIEKEQSKEVS